MLASKRSRIEVFPAPEDALAPGVAIRVVSPPVAVKEAGTKTPAPFKAVRNQTPRVRPRNRTGKP